MKLRFTIIFLLLIFTASSQEYGVRISKITDQHGVDVPSTFGITQDPFGFIWFGTVGGLYRYDGVNMQVYRNIPDDTTSLSNSTIRTILMDSINGKIYVGTQQGGLNVFDVNTHKIKHYLHNKNSTNCLQDNNIWSLMLDNNGHLWIGMENSKLNKFIPSENKFINIEIIPEELEARNGRCTIRTLFQDSNGNIYVGTDRYGIYIIHMNGEVSNIDTVVINNEERPLAPSLALTEDKTGKVWLATYGTGMVAIDPAKRAIVETFNTNHGLVSNLCYSVIIDETSRLWIGTEYGLTIYDRKNNRVDQYDQNISRTKGLTDNRIRKVFQDSYGIIWIGSEAGVDKLVEQSIFKIYQNDLHKNNSMPKGIVRSVFKDKQGMVWVGLIDKGLVKYNSNTREFTHYINSKAANSQLMGYQISAILEDSQNNFWVGDWDNGLLKFDRTQERFEKAINSFSGKVKLSDNRIQAIVEGKNNILWLATENGVNLYDPINQRVEYLKHDINNPNSISGNGIQSQALKLDSKGNLWVGTWSSGLNYVEIKNTKPLKYNVTRFKERDQKIWNQMNHVISLYLQNDTTLWIGTFGNGLYHYNISTDSVIQYDVYAGLPNNIVYSVLPGGGNTLWLSTDYGLSQFNTQTQEFVNFDVSDGLQDNHFFWGAAHKSFDGELFFGGINGLNSFYPNEIKAKNEDYPVLITGINVFHKPYQSNLPYEDIKHVVLNYDQNFITIDFAILDYFEPTSNSFRVKLLGLESQWNNIGKQRTVNYSNLAPGKYNFVIQASNSQSNWEAHSKTIGVWVKTPWWEKPWAIALFVFAIMFIIYLVYYLRIKVLTAQKKLLEQKVKERTSELLEKSKKLAQQNDEINLQREELSLKNKQISDALTKLSQLKEKAIESEKMASLGVLASGVAHEINNPLNYIQGGVFGIEQHLKNNECGHAQQNRTFLQAIKTGVKRVAAIVSSLDQFSKGGESLDENCNIKEIINNCLVILSSQFKNKITVINEIEKESDYTVKGNPGKLHQAFLNILTNAEQSITGTGTIAIESEKLKGKLKLSITDSGSGINNNILNRITEPFFTTKDPGEGTGLGLSLTYRIIQEHGGQLLFNSEVGKGTQVDVILPIERTKNAQT